MAPGTTMPMAANPMEMMQVLDRSARYTCDIHTLWAPTSEMAMSCGPPYTYRKMSIERVIVGLIQ